MSAGAPVSLALTNTLPAPSSLPPSLPFSILPQPNLPGGPAINSVATTRILHLSAFSPELKTRDIQSIFAEWEDERGGFKIKWVDDTTAMIVFQEATVAKKAFLTLLANPHPLLTLPTPLSPTGAKLRAHTGPDATHILTSVQNRPRSRSNAQAHSRKSSMNVQPTSTAGHRRDSQGGSGGAAVGSVGSRRQGSMSGSRPSAQQIQERIEEITSSAVLTQETPDGAVTTGNAATTPPAISGSPTSADASFVTAAGSPPKINDAGRRHLNAALGINGNQIADGVKGMTIVEAGDEAP